VNVRAVRHCWSNYDLVVRGRSKRQPLSEFELPTDETPVSRCGRNGQSRGQGEKALDSVVVVALQSKGEDA
jgi:hypothetical protein